MTVATAVCVDASLVIKWLIAEDDGAPAEALADNWTEHRVKRLAPDLLAFEVTNVLWQQCRRKRVSYERALAALEAFWAFPIHMYTSESLCREGLLIARQYELPSAYDAQYLALAIMAGCDLWTADRKLYGMVSGTDAPVRFFTEPPLPL